jgi:predicted RNA-binding Zn-ribbon protein involved in translation (DUF1610 family)
MAPFAQLFQFLQRNGHVLPHAYHAAKAGWESYEEHKGNEAFQKEHPPATAGDRQDGLQLLGQLGIPAPGQQPAPKPASAKPQSGGPPSAPSEFRVALKWLGVPLARSATGKLSGPSYEEFRQAVLRRAWGPGRSLPDVHCPNCGRATVLFTPDGVSVCSFDQTVVPVWYCDECGRWFVTDTSATQKCPTCGRVETGRFPTPAWGKAAPLAPG